jgi:hypothetical protein
MSHRIKTILSVALVVAIGAIYGLTNTACNKVQQAPPSHQVMAQQFPFSCPTNQSVPVWYIDPSNASGCASDLNSGTTDVCTGGSGAGPLLHFKQLTALWCTNQPVLTQTTAIVLMSDMTDTTDKFVFKPLSTNGSQVVIMSDSVHPAPGFTPCSGTLGTVTAKNRATPQLLQAVFPTGCGQDAGANLVQGAIAVNGTNNDAGAGVSTYASLYKIQSGTTWTVTQPIDETNILGGTSPTTTAPAEGDSWTSGDSVTVYRFPRIDLAEISPIPSADDSGIANPVTIVNLTIFDTSGTAGTNPLLVGGTGYVNFVNDVIQKPVQLISNGVSNNTQKQFATGFYNCQMAGGIYGGESYAGATTAALRSSIVVAGSFSGGQVPKGTLLDGDVIIASSAVANSATLGLAYIGSTFTLNVASSGIGYSQYNSNKSIVWGPGGLNVSSGARYRYGSGASEGAAEFKITGTFSADGQSKACLDIPSLDAGYSGATPCNRTLSGTNVDTDLGTVSGCYRTGTSAICNY